MIKGNEPATGYGFANENKYANFIGLTIRQHFAALAMQGLMAVPNKGDNTWRGLAEKAAEISVEIADALINELNKTEKQ